MAAPKLPRTKAKDKPGSEDTALICGVSKDGSVHILRKRADGVEAGVVRPLQEGKPITGEVVSLKRRPEHPLLCDVTVEYNGGETAPEPAPKARSNKPAKVASDAYRNNWNAIWSSKPSGRGLAN